MEGDGEVRAVPLLLRRMVPEIDSECFAEVPRGYRWSRSSLTASGGLEAAVGTVAALYRDHAILVLIDSDDDCPAALGTELQMRVKASRPDLRVSVVLAHREYEAWLLASAESLAGKKGLPTTLAGPPEPETIRDAKGWLTTQLPGSARYRETQDQEALSALMDFQLALDRSRSFRKLWKEVQALIQSAPLS